MKDSMVLTGGKILWWLALMLGAVVFVPLSAAADDDIEESYEARLETARVDLFVACMEEGLLLVDRSNELSNTLSDPAITKLEVATHETEIDSMVARSRWLMDGCMAHTLEVLLESAYIIDDWLIDDLLLDASREKIVGVYAKAVSLTGDDFGLSDDLARYGVDVDNLPEFEISGSGYAEGLEATRVNIAVACLDELVLLLERQQEMGEEVRRIRGTKVTDDYVNRMRAELESNQSRMVWLMEECFNPMYLLLAEISSSEGLILDESSERFNAAVKRFSVAAHNVLGIYEDSMYFARVHNRVK